MKHFFVFIWVTVVHALKMEAQGTNGVDYDEVVSSEDIQTIDVGIQTEDNTGSVQNVLVDQLGLCIEDGATTSRCKQLYSYFADKMNSRGTLTQKRIWAFLALLSRGLDLEVSQYIIAMAMKGFKNFVEEVAELNDLSAADLMRNVQVDKKDSSKVLGNVEWTDRRIRVLPDSIGGITVGGTFRLYKNKLRSLPDSFGKIKVGGNLMLVDNKLKSLPHSFGEIKVGGDLSLAYNRLTTLPESFGKVNVGGCLSLNHNKLTGLLDSIGKIKVGRSVYLNNNRLESLPDSIGNIRFGDYLHLHSNELTTFPDSFDKIASKCVNY